MRIPFVPILLFADAGVPMIFLTFPAMVVLLLPIIALEAWIYRRLLPIDMKTAAKSSSIANIASTIVGIPIAWGATLLFEFGLFWAITKFPGSDQLMNNWGRSPLMRVVGTILASAWLGPDEKHLYWMIPLAVIVLMVPSFLISVWIEARIVDHIIDLPEAKSDNALSNPVRVAVWKANVVSYGLLIAGSTAWLLIALLRPPSH